MKFPAYGQMPSAVRGRFRGPNVRDKTETLAWNCADELLSPAAVAEGLAHGIDAAVERRVRHDAAAPDRCNQIVFADDAIAVLDQVNQQVKDLRLDRNVRATRVQFPPLAVEREIIE